MKRSYAATAIAFVLLVGCKKQTDAVVKTSEPESKPIVTIFEQNVTTVMTDAAAKQFYCDDDISKKQFVEAGVRIGWDSAEKSFNSDKANKDLDKWFSETRDTMLQGGTAGAGESIPTTADAKGNALPENRCLVLGRTIAYAWFMDTIQTQLGLARCQIPAERVGLYSALLFYRMQSLQKTLDGAYSKFALILSDVTRATNCAGDYLSTCSKAFEERLNALDNDVLKPKDGSEPVSKPQMFAENYCR